MKTLSIVLLVLAVGCSEWHPDLSKPVAVDLDDSLSTEQAKLVVYACQELNTAVGAEILKPVVGNDRIIQRNRIHVDDGTPKSEALANAIQNPWSCRINLGRAVEVSTAMHELLHCLGYEHVEEKTDVMYYKLRNDQELKPWLINDLRERAGLDAE